MAIAGVTSMKYGLVLLDPGPLAIPLVTASAFLGSYLESIAGSWNRKLDNRKRGRRSCNNYFRSRQQFLRSHG